MSGPQPWAGGPAGPATPPGAASAAGYPVAPPSAVPRRLQGHRLLYVLVSVIGCVAVILVAITVLLRPSKPTCGLTRYQPPSGPPVAAQHVYTSSQYHYTIGYYDSQGGGIPQPQVSTDGNNLVLSYGTLGALRFTAVPPNGQTPEQVATAFVDSLGVNAQEIYQLPNAQVGYQIGYGAAWDIVPQSGSGSGGLTRLIVQVAQRGNLDILAVCEGPFVRFSPNGTNDGHPSPADTPVALLADEPIDAVAWPGESSPFSR